MITKEQVILYFIHERDDIVIKIDDLLYTDLNNSLTFKQLQEIDHSRTRLHEIDKIIDFLEKEGN